MRRVLLLCIIANPNSIHIQRWVNYFAHRGHEVHLIGEKPLQVALPDGVIFHDLTQNRNLRKVRYLGWTPVIRRLVRQIQPSVLHAHQVSGAGWLGAATGYHPFLVTTWGSDLLVGARHRPAQHLLARWVLRRADYVTCVSENLAQAALALGADPARLAVAPWGVDTEIFRSIGNEARLALRASMGLGSGPIVLCLRALQPIYNPLDVAQAIPRILQQVPTAQFQVRTFSADPDILTQFHTILKEAHVEHAVRFIGDIRDDRAIAAQYQVADIAISVPSSDGTPSSVLEAMACGAVPVVSDLPSLREWIEHEKQGLLVPTNDVEAIAAAVIRLAKDQVLQERMSSCSQVLVQTRADREQLMQRAEEIYHKLARSAVQ